MGGNIIPGPTVVALEILQRYNEDAYSSLEKESFDNQLNIFTNKIKEICKKLDEENASKPWIIAWREYGLTDGNERGIPNRYLSLDQKRKLKDEMSQLTKDYPQLTIIAGTVATQRPIHPEKKPEVEQEVKTEADEQSKKQSDKIHKLKEAIEKPVYEDYEAATAKAKTKLRTLLMMNDFFVVKNTSYVFSNGSCIAKHDKTVQFEETAGFEPADKVIFKPGKAKSHNPVINENIGIEICAEHGDGYMRQHIEVTHQPKPLIQFILSASKNFDEQNFVSPYAVHIDSEYKTQLITNIRKQDAEVTLYTCNVLSDTASLTRTDPCEASRILPRQRSEDRGFGVSEYYEGYDDEFVPPKTGNVKLEDSDTRAMFNKKRPITTISSTGIIGPSLGISPVAMMPSVSNATKDETTIQENQTAIKENGAELNQNQKENISLEESKRDETESHHKGPGI